MSDKNALIYIMGRGYSGSTLLSGLLNEVSGVTDVGELVSPLDGYCGCGKLLRDCEFWMGVREEFERISGLAWEPSMDQLRLQGHIKFFPQTMFARSTGGKTRILQQINEALFESIRNVTKNKYIVDSSKQPSRALFLMRHMRDVKFLMIIKRPEGYLASYMKRMKRGYVLIMRRRFKTSSLNFLLYSLVSIGWVIAYLQAELIRLMDPNRVLRVRYEDLVNNPRHELLRIGAFLNLDLSPVLKVAEEQQTMRVGHIIAGNVQIRAAEGFVFEPKTAIHKPLPLFYRILVRCVSWPLMLLYGYPLFRRTDMPIGMATEEEVEDQNLPPTTTAPSVKKA